ncbi:MAG: MBL fold metallo-hydrolase [Acidobacteriota bacterium]
MPTTTLNLGELSIEGWSRAGEATWLKVSPPGLALDVGRGAVELSGTRDLFLTHGHLDHALGLPFVLSRRAREEEPPSRVFCPRPMVGDLVRFVEAAARLERAEYRYEVLALDPGDRVPVGRDLTIEAFATHHVVPSLGFHLVRARRRLKDAFRGRSGEELGRLRREGVDFEEATEEDWLSYCGDTGPKVFDSEPRIFSSRVLVLECTFLDPEKRASGVLYQHLHMDDLAARAERFENQELVLCHLSRRHRLRDGRQRAAEIFTGPRPRVHWIPAEEEP